MKKKRFNELMLRQHYSSLLGMHSKSSEYTTHPPSLPRSTKATKERKQQPLDLTNVNLKLEPIHQKRKNNYLLVCWMLE